MRTIGSVQVDENNRMSIYKANGLNKINIRIKITNVKIVE